MDIYFVIGHLIWAFINYYAANYVADNNKGLKINPVLYVIGSLAFGGIFPLIFLVIKYMYYSYRVKNK